MAMEKHQGFSYSPVHRLCQFGNELQTLVLSALIHSNNTPTRHSYFEKNHSKTVLTFRKSKHNLNSDLCFIITIQSIFGKKND